MVCLCRDRGQNSQWGLTGGRGGGTVHCNSEISAFHKRRFVLLFHLEWSEIPSRVKSDVSERLKVDGFLVSEGLRSLSWCTRLICGLFTW